MIAKWKKSGSGEDESWRADLNGHHALVFYSFNVWKKWISFVDGRSSLHDSFKEAKGSAEAKMQS